MRWENVAIFMTMVTVISNPATAQNLDELLTRCSNHFSDPDLGISACTLIVQSGQASGAKLGAALAMRAGAYFEEHAFDNAIQDLDKALALAPNDIVASASYSYRGDAYIHRKEFDRAIQDFDKAVALNPNNGYAHLNRCLTRTIVKPSLDAVADCTEAIRLQPGKADDVGTRGFAYLKLQKLELAIADFSAALNSTPKDEFSLFGRGVAKRLQGDKKGGDTDIAAAMAINPHIAKDHESFGVTPP